MWRFLMGAIILALASTVAEAKGGSHTGSTYFTHGYTRSNGSYVQPHYSTSPNKNRSDNWSTKGNVNPYTGKPGTKPAYRN